MKVHRLLLILTAIFLASTTTLHAQVSRSDRGKRLLPKLFSELLSNINPSTVRIQVDGKDAAMGVIVSPEGHILTKGSEIRGEFTVKLHDGTAYDGKLIGYHEPSDLGLVKIDGFDLKTIQFSDGDLDIPGNWVAAVDINSEPLAVGVISAKARKLFGPEALIENANKGYIGIRFGTGPSAPDEVVISEIVKGAAADSAGLKVNDIIVEVEGEKIKNRDQLPDIMNNYRPGDKVTVKVRRKVNDDIKEMEFKVTLSPRSKMSRGDLQNVFGGELSGRRGGFPKVIQHDTVVKPEDCGGPLVDLDGNIIGINIARAGRVETWALPVAIIKPILKDLLDGKFAVRKPAKVNQEKE